MTSRVIANLALTSISGREITWGCMAVMLALNPRSGNKCVASPQADTVYTDHNFCLILKIFTKKISNKLINYSTF